MCIASIAHGVSQFLNSCRNALQPKPRQILEESDKLNRIGRKRDELGGLLERGVGVGETLEGVGVDGAEQRYEEVGEVREAVAGEAWEVGEGGEGVGEKGGTRRGGDGDEGGESSAVRRGDSVDHVGEVVADAAVRLAHAQVRCHLRRRRWGFGFRIRRRRLEEAGIGFDPDGGDGGVTIVGEWWRSATLTVDREIDGYVRVLLG